MRMKKAIFISTIFVSLAALFNFFLAEFNTGDKESLSEIQLGGIRYDLEIFDLSNDSSSVEIKKKVAESILREVILVRSIAPNVTELKGEGLEILCILLEREYIFDLVENDDLANLAKKYLSSIEAEVKNTISTLQKSMKGKGCFISPNS